MTFSSELGILEITPWEIWQIMFVSYVITVECDVCDHISYNPLYIYGIIMQDDCIITRPVTCLTSDRSNECVI